MDFVHLHGHSDGSLQDGLGTPEKIIAKAAQSGQPAVAITDHGTLCNVIRFLSAAKNPIMLPKPLYNPTKSRSIDDEYKAQMDDYELYKDNKVKPIIGVEAYICRDMYTKSKTDAGEYNGTNHIVLLVKNQRGYENLVELTTKSYTEGFYRRPRIDYALLEKYSEGVIALSACIQGFICQDIKHRGEDEAQKTVEQMLGVFGDDFYLEVMYHTYPDEADLMPKIIRLGQKMNVPIVATNDYHYINKDDAFAQRVLVCAQTHSTIGSPSGMVPDENKDEFYVKSTDEMYDVMKSLTKDSSLASDMLQRSLEVAEKVTLELNINNDVQFPVIDVEKQHLESFGKWHKDILPDRPKKQAYLAFLVTSGLKNKGKTGKQYINRAKRELKAIYNSGFTSYFLMTKKTTDYARRNDIRVGPGRGSGVGCLCLYALDITNMDPLEYGLSFERFLNAGRQNIYDFNFEELPIEDWKQSIGDE